MVVIGNENEIKEAGNCYLQLEDLEKDCFSDKENQDHSNSPF